MPLNANQGGYVKPSRGRELSPAYQAAIETLRRFPGVSVKSLAEYIMARRRGLFSGYDSARTALRECAGLASKRGGSGSSYKKYFMHVPGLSPNAGRAVMPKSLREVRVDYRLPAGTWGILADAHIPFHDQRALDAALAWFKRERVTGIIMSDAFDCEAVSYWKPTRPRDFLSEVEAFADFLDVLRREFPKTSIVMQRGNHEERIEQYFRANAPMLADLPVAGMGEILRLDERGVTLLDRKQKVVAHELTILHGHEMRGAYSAVSPSRWALLRAKSCVTIGHFHQTSETTETALNGVTLAAWSIGCLCDLNPDYSPWGNRWNHGAAILHYPGQGWELENRKILPNGKIV